MKLFIIGFWAVVLFSHEATTSCTVGNAFWLQASKGPKVTQPTQADPTKVLVNWSNMLKKPECVDEFHIYVWRKDVDGILTQHRDIGPITKTTTSFVVDQINPCVDHYFVVEYWEKHKWGGKPTKVKSGKTLHRNKAQAVLQSRDSTKVAIEYMYRNITMDHDLSKAVLRFGVNDLVKYPNCLKRIDVSGQINLQRRYKRTIGKVPNYGSPMTSSSRTSSSRTSSYSSTFGTSGGPNLNPTKQFTPPFKGQNNNVELTMNVSPCKRYTFSMKFIGTNGVTIGEVVGIQMKALDQMPNVILPPLMKVLRMRQRSSTLTIDLQPNSPIPASCLLTYIQAIDNQLRAPNQKSSLSSGRDQNDQLRQNGCSCSNTTIVDVMSSDVKVNTKHKDALGQYIFEGNFHDGKIFFVRRTGPPMNKIYYLFWSKIKDTWWIGDSLSTLSPIFKMADNLAQILTCPSNPKPPGKFWKRKGTFGWSDDKTMNIVCGRTTLKPTPIAPLGSNQYLFQMGCSCSNTSSVTVSSNDSRTLKKQKPELGVYLFKDGQVHDGKPYYIQQAGAVKRFLFFNKKKNTWWISGTLGGNSLIKLEDNAGTNCPENITPKKWTRKNALGVWTKDSTLTLTCKGFSSVTSLPSSRQQRPSPRPSINPTILSRLGCTCSHSATVNVTSSNSRTLKKHKVELGAYAFKEGQIYEDNPYYIHQAGAVKRFLFFNKPKKSWWISGSLGGNAIIKLEDNAGINCPENATPKKWMRKNAFGIWSKDSTLKLKCIESTAPTSWSPSRPTSRPSYFTTSRSPANPVVSSMLQRSGCQCTKEKIKVSSTDSRTKSKHFDRLGIFTFKGQLFNGKPYYEKLVQAKKYFLFFDVSHKTWNVGETLGGSALLKTQNNFDRTCPADRIVNPSSQKFWQRKNAFGIWGKDKTLKMECV